MKSFTVFCVCICFIGTMALLYNFGLGYIQTKQNMVAIKGTLECRQAVIINRYSLSGIDKICGPTPKIEGIL